MSKVESIMSAFIDEEFQKILLGKHITIESILRDFIKNLSVNKVSKEINSRIKSNESLREKLERKDYISQWEVNINDKIDIQKKICENLPDLIGFRLNCYFKEDEKLIFEELKKYFENRSDIEVEEKTNNKQKNGHVIYKIACKYRELNNFFSFEVQVKSLLNDLWGEVEHSTIYKSRVYDSREKLKKNIVDGLYDILNGADIQLNKLFSFKIGLKEIKNELFSKYIEDVVGSNGTMILSEDISNFFELTKYIKGSIEYIDEYLGMQLLNKDYLKKEIEHNNEKNNYILEYKNSFDEFKWKKFCKIIEILYEFEDEDSLLEHIIEQIHTDAYDPDDYEDLESDEIERMIFDATMETLNFFKKVNNTEKED